MSPSYHHIKQEPGAMMSKTMDYRKNKKPKLEKQRRDAINTCTDTLRDLIFDYPGGREKSSKMEKRVLMEEVVKYVVRAKQRERVLMVMAQSNPSLYLSAVNGLNKSVDVSSPLFNPHLTVRTDLYRHHHHQHQQHQQVATKSPSLDGGYDSERDLTPSPKQDISPSPKNQDESVWRPF